MATYHIAKSQNIQGVTKTIYYQGDKQWTTELSDRKTWTNKSTATSELYSFGGTVITE